jgi:hypothetical protein
MKYRKHVWNEPYKAAKIEHIDVQAFRRGILARSGIIYPDIVFANSHQGHKKFKANI